MPALGESVTEGTVTRWLKAEGDDGRRRRAAARGLDRQGRHRDPVARRRHPDQDPRPGGRHRAGRRRPRRHRRLGGGGCGSRAQQQPRSAGRARSSRPPSQEAPQPAGSPAAAPRRPRPPAPSAGPSTGQQATRPGGAGSRPTPAAPPPQQAHGAGPHAPAAARSVGAATRRRGLRHPARAQARRRPRRRPRLAQGHRRRRPHPQAGRARRGRGRQGGRAGGPAAAAAGRRAAAAAAAAPAASASAAVSPKRGTTEKMSRLRKTIATRMVESLQVSAQLTTVVEVDVTKIARLRAKAKSDFEQREGTKLSFLPFFALAAVEALKAHPMVNASIEGDRGDLPRHREPRRSRSTPRSGLLVPVIKNAGDLNIAGLAREIADLAERTRTNKITPDELGGGTFTITNTGSRGALFDTPIINQPQVAILGTGAVVKRPVVVTDAERRRDDRDPLDGLPRAVLRPPRRRRRRRGPLPQHDEGASRGRQLRVRPRSLTGHSGAAHAAARRHHRLLRSDRRRAVGVRCRARRRGRPPGPPRPARAGRGPVGPAARALDAGGPRRASTRSSTWPVPGSATSAGRRPTSTRSSPPASTAPRPSRPAPGRRGAAGAAGQRRPSASTATAATRCSPRSPAPGTGFLSEVVRAWEAAPTPPARPACRWRTPAPAS